MTETLKEIMEEYERLGKLIQKLESEIEDNQNTESEETKLPEEQVKAEVKKLITLLGVGHLSGKQYLAEMVAIYYQYPTELIFGKKLYEVIAKRCNSNHSTVREGIKYVIETAYQKGNKKLFQSIVCDSIDDAKLPSNEEFVAAIVAYLNIYVI